MKRKPVSRTGQKPRTFSVHNVFDALINKYGAENRSKVVNEALAEYFLKRSEEEEFCSAWLVTNGRES
jgi:hypothetical protein